MFYSSFYSLSYSMLFSCFWYNSIMLATSLKTGTVFKEGDHPFLVVKYEHTKTARGGATVKVKAKNLLTGQVLEKGYKSSDKIEDADITRKNIQYLYKDNNYNFMDPNTYEQIYLTDDIVGENAKFLLEGEFVQLMSFEDTPVSIELPNSMIFEIKETVPGYKGNTISNVYKDAVLQNGAIVKVPTFAKEGDKIKIDTRTGEYVSKA